MNFIPIARPQSGPEELAAVSAVLASGQWAAGPRVREFEAHFAEWCGVKHAVATSSGTTALHLALLAHGIGPGDEVVTPSFSFVASANCVLYAGARPVFADIEPDYYTLDPADAARRITPQTRAIIAVHLYGQPCDMDALAALAAERGLVLIEDACQAHGARWRGRMVGAHGTACYSFYATKNMSTGEGGMLTTNDDTVAAQARLLREHGSPVRYRHEILGYNHRLTDLQAALGLAQLERVEAWNRQRQANAACYDAALRDCARVRPPRVRPHAAHVYHQYTVRLAGPQRDEAVAALTAAGIGTGVHYPLPIHQQPLYHELGYDVYLPHTDQAAGSVLSLPVHPSLTPAELERVCAAVRAL